MISKELLSEVKNEKVRQVIFDLKEIHHNIRSDVRENEIVFFVNKWEILNKDELLRMCKDFVYNNSMNEIASYSIQDSEQYRCIVGTDLKFGSKDKQGFYGDTELEAVIKATEWVLNKTKKHILKQHNTKTAISSTAELILEEGER